MGNVGRIVCVALPFILTVASVIALLVAALAGVTDKSLYVFKLNTTDLSISASDISSLLSSRDVGTGPDTPTPVLARDLGGDISGTASSLESSAGSAASDLKSDFGSLVESASAAAATATSAASAIDAALSSTNITAADLSLADVYTVSLWNYCFEASNGTTKCTTPAFNWASNTTDAFEQQVSDVSTSMGYNVTLPDDVKTALSAFGTVSRWTEIVFIIAFVALGLETIVGFFSSCSRAVSCCTWVVAVFATVAVGAAAGLSTALASVVVGAVEGTAKAYGVTATFNTRYLATVWIAFAFALAACLFWVFTICCCAPDHRSKAGRRGGAGGYTKHLDDDAASMTPASGSYAPIGAGGNAHYNGAGYGAGYGAHDTSYQGHGAHNGAAASYYNNDKGFEPMRHQQV